MQELTERVVKVETRLDIQDKRLGSHGDRIGNLEQHNVRQDVLLEKLCRSQDKTNELAVENSKKLKNGYAPESIDIAVLWWKHTSEQYADYYIKYLNEEENCWIV